MPTLDLKATTTATDTEQGTFVALVSGWAADREADVIAPTAFDKTIEAWRESGKRLPLLLNHSTTAVGAIDPASMRTTDEGLVVAGQVDRDSEQGRMVWRTIKSGSAGFSIGYKGEYIERADGSCVLTSIDLLEISATSAPMHAATRALSWKAATEDNFCEQVAAILTKEDDAASVKSAEPLRIAMFEC
jgi:HK97 family phage prohead protease